MDCPSTPAAPLFALTLLYASHTSRFGMLNGFPSGPDLPTRLLPEHRLVARESKPQMSRPLRSAPITGVSSLLRAGPPACAATVLTPPSFCRSAYSLSHPLPEQQHQALYQHMPSHVLHSSRRSGSRRLHAGHRLASKRAPARLIPGWC